eukprot:COSAG04_NODE_298_length_17490_cov_10.214249_10_plen_163_part_00
MSIYVSSFSSALLSSWQGTHQRAVSCRCWGLLQQHHHLLLIVVISILHLHLLQVAFDLPCLHDFQTLVLFRSRCTSSSPCGIATALIRIELRAQSKTILSVLPSPACTFRALWNPPVDATTSRFLRKTCFSRLKYHLTLDGNHRLAGFAQGAHNLLGQVAQC